MKTAEELIKFVKGKVGTPYVFGACGKVLTEQQLATWAKLYPNIYTASYLTKARKYIGQVCNDCAGLLDEFFGQDRGSAWYRNNATKRVPIKKLDETMRGWAVYKPGHIGIYIGDGKVVEARGINYGTIISNVAEMPWTEVCQLKDIQYTPAAEPELDVLPCKADRGLTVTASSLRIRCYPRTGAVVGAYSQGTKIYPTGKVYVTPTDVWLRTNKGYVSRKYLEGWITEAEGKWYLEAGNHYPHSELREIDGEVYAFNDAGWLITGKTIAVKASEDGSITLVQ